MSESSTETRIVDPTPSTEARILSQVTAVEKVFDQKIMSILVEIESMKQANKLFHEDLTRVPTAVDKAVAALKELVLSQFSERLNTIETKFDERFLTIMERIASISIQLRDRDDRVRQTALDAKAAHEALITGQEKSSNRQNESNAAAAAKSEENFSKQLETQRQLLDARTGALSDKIDSLKDLVIRGEGRDTGKSTSLGVIFAVIGAMIGIGGIVIAVLKLP